MFHTAYNSFESKPNGRDYIGKHSSKDPYDDYKGSFKDETFNPDQKIILAYSKTAEGAVWFEINFQKVFNVVEEPQFANRALQTSTGFDTTGRSHTPEYKRKRSERMTGEKNPMFGRSGELSPAFGRTFSDENRRNISEAKLGDKHPQSKKVKVTFPDGKDEIYPFARDASETLKCNYGSLKRWCRTNYTVRRGFLSGCSFSYV